MASIRDVAKRAGVAACTVSRMLNGSASVTLETRQKIERAMEELNYIPNELARGMFRQRSGIIAMLVPSIKHPFFSSLADCIEKELYLRGYRLMLCSTSGSLEREQDYLNRFRANLVDGVIMGVSGLGREVYEKFGKPLIMLDCKVSEEIPFVVSDHKMGGALAAKEFKKNGCRYVLHLCAEKEEKEILSYEGHRELERVLGEAGIRTRGLEIKWNSFDQKGYREMAELILRKNPEIDGVMAADMPAVAFYEAARKLGRKIPGDFCVIAYDGTYVLDIAGADITAVVQGMERYSTEVVQVMLELLSGQGGRGRSRFLPVSLRKGKTS